MSARKRQRLTIELDDNHMEILTTLGMRTDDPATTVIRRAIRVLDVIITAQDNEGTIVVKHPDSEDLLFLAL